MGIENLILIAKSIILGVVEGITEFLPISSTGHMIIVGHFINFSGDFAKLFEIVIQLGAILAVIVLFRNKIFGSFKKLKPKEEGFRLWTNLALAFIPVGIFGLFFHKIIEKYLMSTVPVAWALLVGGIWMIYAENKYRNNSKIQDIDKIGYKEAFIIGCFQCLSILWPGFSRSAATIIGGWIMGLSSIAAAEFSFFLAIPTMIVASAFELLKSGSKLSRPEIFALIIGFVVSFIVAIIVVAKFIEFLKTKPMKSFAVYRIFVGIIILIFAYFKII
ncbi:MAG: undecaprenyl-diphosphate phosphatase [Candidatus Gastranaerophilales bacterium]|nr:undecaprenyl-diphosphate phosphatase [Candidatus Gastranaerophilales bacterium]